MAGTTIDGLNSVTSLTSQDEVPVWDAEASGEPTKKITAQNMAASVKTLGSLVNTSEMNSALAGKQNTLTFDTTPTTGSTNPVTSGGIATAIAQSTANLIVAEDSVITSPGTFNANASKSVSFPAAKSGYTRLGCIGLTGSGTSGLVVQEYYNSTNSVVAYYRNVTSSAITPSRLVATILYRKDT
jgi:hypothetical protein